MRSSLAGFLAALAAGLVIGATVLGNAAAAPAAPVAAPAVKTVTHHYALGTMAFAADEVGDTTKSFDNFWDGVALSDTTGTRCFNAGLSLPTDATLKSVTFFYNKGKGLIGLHLIRQNVITHKGVELADFADNTTTSNPHKSATVKIKASQSKVDLSRFAYGAGVCPSADTSFSGLVVTYTEPAR
ncbi:MAG TPA: hypothetical protein VFI65_06330 [Streptosporangiaceae bacterium]|nr:hypothetical protein [Streptosporangiaceae bacterium]